MASSRDDSSDDSGEKKEAPAASSSARIAAELQVSVVDLQKIINLDYVKSQHYDPVSEADKTGSRVYTIKNHHNEDVRFFVFGCQGDKKTGQAKVAEHLKKIIAEHPELKPDFIVLLGDNFYPNGVDSPDDERFEEQFYKMYDIPCFVVPGNHDYGYTNEEKINYSSKTVAGKARGRHQDVHSYSKHPGDPEIPMTMGEFWRQEELDLASLPKWCKPAPYYSVIIGNLQLFFMDSNHLADDYLSIIENVTPVDPQKNQAAWLAREFEACKKAGRTPVLFQHHPLVDLSKRARYGDGDAHLYFKHDPERWKRLAKLFGLDVNDYKHDALLTKVYTAMGIKWATSFAAHVHAMYNYVTPDASGFVIGSGGGKLQDRMYFRDNENIGFFLQELGFMAFSCNKKSPAIMNLRAFTLAGHELTLTTARARPFTDFPDTDTADLYNLVLQACNEYAATLAELLAEADRKNKPNIEFYPYRMAKLRNYGHEPTLYDVDGMHHIVAYFCQPELGDFQLVLTRLDELMHQLTQRTEDSLYEKINRTIKQSRFGKTVQEMLDVNIAEPVSTSKPLGFYSTNS